MAVDTSQRTESIEQLVDSIEKRDITLPEFQRDFVWEESKTYDLFDSIIRDIFIGSLIYGIPSFELTVRELDSRPRKGSGSRKKLSHQSLSKSQINTLVKTGHFRLLLDGQQRVTSLYRALKDIDQVWIIIRNDDELPPDVRKKLPADRSLEEVMNEVAGKESPDHLSILLGDVYRMLKGHIVRERDKANLLAKTVYWKSQNLQDIQNSPLFEEYLTLTLNIQNILRAEKLLSYYLLDTDEEKFALFFERSNSKGIQLSFIDILAAKLYSGFNLRAKVEEFSEENPDYGLGQNEIVRAISFIASGGQDIGRKYILKSLTHAHFNENWDKLCMLYKKCLNYLYDNNFLISQDWLPYESIILPLIIFLREIPQNDFSQINQLQSRFLKYWYWSAIFSQRYSVAALGLILQDMNILRSVAQENYTFDRHYLGFPYEIKDGKYPLTTSNREVFHCL